MSTSSRDDAADFAVAFGRKLPDRGEVAAGRLERARRASRPSTRAIVWIGCELEDVISGGDHVIVTGRVLEIAERPGNPLLFHQGAYRPAVG